MGPQGEGGGVSIYDATSPKKIAFGGGGGNPPPPLSRLLSEAAPIGGWVGIATSR